MAEACVRSSPFLLLAFAATLFGTPVIAQVQPAALVARHPVPGTSSKSVKELPMPMTAPLFLESATYTSTLYLVNQLNFGVQADVSVYDMSGALLMTGHRYLEANSSQNISIRKLLGDAGLFAEVGSVEIVSPENSAALLGQLSITKTDQNQEYLDQELFMPETTGSRSLRAVIDSPQNSPIVAVTNVSTMVAQTLQISCISSTGSSVLKTINLQPKQTKLVRACSSLGDVAFSPDAVDSQFILEPESTLGMSGQNVAGISITATGGPPSEIAAFGFVEHADNYGHYFSAMNFADPALLNSTATVFTGVPVGPSAITTGQAYTPQVALTNFSQSPQTTSISFATSAAGLSDSKVIAQVTLPPNSSKFLDLPAITGSPRWENSFIVSSSGQPGDVISKMMFKTVGPLPNIELIGKDERDNHNGGDHPWSVENGTRSNLYIFNHGTTTRKVGLRIGSGSNVWLKLYDLHSNETKSIAIGDLIQSGLRDDKGYAFPKNTTHGEISWWAPKAGAPEVTGRVVQADMQGTMARNFSCGSEMGICDLDPFFYEDYFEVGVGDEDALPATPVYCVYTPGASGGACPSGGQTTSQTAQLQWTWNSQQPSIAFIASGSSTATATWKGMSGGSTSFTTVALLNEENYCTGQGNMNSVAVSQSPATISVSSGDPSPQIAVAVTPTSFAPDEVFSVGMSSNPNSGSTASLTSAAPKQFNGTNDIWTFSISGSNSPSGVFSATACASVACASTPTIITIPPQVVIQMMYAEANGTGSQTAMESLGETMSNRFTSSYFSGSGYTTWQTTLVTSQVAVNQGITTGVQPELGAAVHVFSGTNGGWCGALAFWTPTASQWAVVNSAISSGTTTYPSGVGSPTYTTFPTSIEQIIYDSSVGTQSNGAPNFLYLAPRPSSYPAAVSASCF